MGTGESFLQVLCPPLPLLFSHGSRHTLRGVCVVRCAMTWLLLALVAFALSLPGVIPQGFPWQNFTETYKSLIPLDWCHKNQYERCLWNCNSFSLSTPNVL